MELSADQLAALAGLREFEASKGLGICLTGPAGTGKTTVINQWRKNFDGEVLLAASTHKAAKVLGEVCGEDTRTVHSILGLKPTMDNRRGREVLKESRKPDSALAHSMLVVDEASMIGGELLTYIHKAATKFNTKVLFIGDPYQLPPVFESSAPVFDVVKCVALTTVHRQALDNPVLALANDFRLSLDGGPTPLIEPRGPTVQLLDDTDFARRLVSEFSNGDNVNQVRALAWTNHRVRELNALVRRSVLGEAATQPYVVGEMFVANSAIMDGDNVLVPNEGEVEIYRANTPEVRYVDEFAYEVTQLRVGFEGRNIDITAPSDWERANTALKLLQRKAGALQNQFYKGAGHVDGARRAAWREFYTLKNSLADLRPPYASTVHKAQGSTYKRVYIDAGDIGKCTHNHVIQRLMYVACTRPSESLVMTGNLPARLYIDREAG